MMEPKRPKYMPDVQKVLQECEPEVLEARTRQAIRGVYEAGLIDRMTPAPVKRPSAPSPWTKGEAAGAGGIDKEALPSAMVPAAEERPVTKRVGVTSARRWPATWIVVLGSIGFMLAVALTGVLVMLGRAKEAAEKAVASAAPAVAPSMTATTPEDAAPKGAAVPRPTAEATASTTATANTTVTPAPRKLPVKQPGPKQKHIEPAPPLSAAPTAPPVLVMTAAPSTPPEPPAVPKIIE